MTDIELFKEYINRICKYYGITYETPYGDLYCEFKNKSGETIATANFTDYNLLAQADILVKALKKYLD